MLRCPRESDDVARHFGRVRRGLDDVTNDFLSGGALLLDRSCDACGHDAHLTDPIADRRDGGYCSVRQSLYLPDWSGDVIGDLARLIGEFLDLRGDHCKAAAGAAGPGSLDVGQAVPAAGVVVSMTKERSENALSTFVERLDKSLWQPFQASAPP